MLMLFDLLSVPSDSARSLVDCSTAFWKPSHVRSTFPSSTFAFSPSLLPGLDQKVGKLGDARLPPGCFHNISCLPPSRFASIAASMSTHSSAEDHSDTFSCTGSDSTSPSSVASHCDEEEQFLRLQDQSRTFVTALLKEKKENEIVLKAWAERCRTLEEELGRLARLVQSMELERGSAGNRKVRTGPA